MIQENKNQEIMIIKRREFIRNTGLAAAGIAIIPGCGQATQKDSPQEIAEVKTDIGLQLYTVRSEVDKDLVSTLTKVSDIGYRYLELYGYGDGKYFGLPVNEFKQVAQDAGLEVRSSHHGTGIIINNSQGSLTNGWEKAAEDAASLGQEYMACAWLHPDERSTEHYQRLPEILNQAGQICKDAGIQFCYHNHEFEFIEQDGMVPMYHILDNTDPDLVKMELDLFWTKHASIDPIEFFNKYPGRTPLWHVKDMNNLEEKKFAEVGTGIIDFDLIFQNADKSGMKYFFVEQDVSDNPLKSIETSFNNVTKIL